MDAYDGYVSSSGAKAKYAGGFGMILTNMNQNVEIDRHGNDLTNRENNTYSCYNCGVGINGDEENWIDEHVYCNECFDDAFAECAECGLTLNRDNMCWSEIDEAYYCDQHSFYCEWCSENYGPRVSTHEIGALLVCEECFVSISPCPRCGSIVNSSDITDGSCTRCNTRTLQTAIPNVVVATSTVGITFTDTSSYIIEPVPSNHFEIFIDPSSS
jgi:hypothetical protein